MFTRVEVKDSYTTEFGGEVLGASFFLCDADINDKGEDPDIENLPTSKIGVGSKALCITTGNIYIFGPSLKWKKYKGVSILN